METTPNNTPAPDSTPTPAPEATPDSTPKPDSTPQTPAPTDATPANPDSGTGEQIRNAPEGGDTVDYQSKFSESTRENQRLMEIMRQEGIDPKTGKRSTPAEPAPTAPATPAPTAPTQPLTYEQAVAQVPGFNTLSEQEKAVVLNPRQAYRDIEQVKQQVAQMYDQQETTRQIKELVGKEDYKDLDQDAFREFIYRDENLGVKNLETLAKMFKLEQADTPPEPPTPEGAEPTTSGAKEIAQGSGTQEMTSADAAQLRTSDPRRYAKLIRTGKLRITS